MITGFHDVLFPTRLSYGTSGGPELRVDVVRLASGFEKRNARISTPKRRYTISAGPRPMVEMRELSSFFEARGGPLNGFRFRDPLEYSTAQNENDEISAFDIEIGTGDGNQSAFALYLSESRRIWTPRSETMRVAADGIELQTGFQFDLDSGELLFDSAPASGVTLTAGFEFDVPVRFENEQIMIATIAKGAGEISEISLVEILL